MIDLKSSRAKEYLVPSLLILVPCTACWILRETLLTTSMDALANFGNIITCSFLRYAPEDDDQEYDDLIRTSNPPKNVSSPKRGSVANTIARFEKELPNETTTSKRGKIKNLEKETCGQKALMGASLFFSFFTRHSTDYANQTKLQSKTSPVISPSRMTKCNACDKKIFPTEESISCRQNIFHIGCFRCSQCGTKLKNDSKEIHQVAGRKFFQCHRCKLKSEFKDKPRQLARIAGEKIEVGEDEQGDIDYVVDTIGDDLEDAMFGMVPHCATCGGDFLKYKGEIRGMGLGFKYHEECWLYGKPAVGLTPAMTLFPKQAAKYLPETLILRLGWKQGKIITTLYFTWKDKEVAVKSMRAEKRTLSEKSFKDPVVVSFELDEDARGNPNYCGKKGSPVKTKSALPGGSWETECQKANLVLSLVGSEQIVPQPPYLLEPISVKYTGTENHKIPNLYGRIGYKRYNLHHSLSLEIPLNLGCDEMDLLGAQLVVHIQERNEGEV